MNQKKLNMKCKIILISLFLVGYSLMGQEIQHQQIIPCSECLIFKKLKNEPRINKFDKKTYYEYLYQNQCARPIKFSWTCNGVNLSRTIAPGKTQKFDSNCGGGKGLEKIQVSCKDS